MDKQTRNILIISAGVIAWYIYKNTNEENAVSENTPTDAIELDDEIIEETQYFDKPDSSNLKTIQFGQLDDSVYKTKKVLSYLSGIEINKSNVYDKELLFLVQSLMEDNPCLVDKETGELHDSLFVNADYILSKIASKEKPDFDLPKIELGECEWINKGHKGKDVLKLNEVICFLTGNKEENALFTKKFGNKIDKIFSGSQIYDNSTNENKVCKRWVYSMYNIISNIKNLSNEKTD